MSGRVITIGNELEVEPLCCCEFIDREGGRRHILAVCCDCEVLDDTCERFLTRSKVPAENYRALSATVEDRLRLPGCGGRGAMKINLDMGLPLVLVPSMILVAAQGAVWTVVSFTSAPLVCYYSYRRCVQRNPRNRFFLAWALSSLVFLMGVMEVEVIPYLEIYLLENVLHKLLVTSMLVSVYFIKKDPGIIDSSNQKVGLPCEDPEDISECTACDTLLTDRAAHCRICNVCVRQRDHHCIWIDACVGANNHRAFLIGLTSLMGAAYYGASLTLTTVCQPVLLFGAYLVPQDCSGVYDSVHLGVCFTSAIYAVIIAVASLCVLVHQVCLISINLTTQEWRTVQRKSGQKGCCPSFRHSSHSKGFLLNWYNFCRGRR